MPVSTDWPSTRNPDGNRTYLRDMHQKVPEERLRHRTPDECRRRRTSPGLAGRVRTGLPPTSGPRPVPRPPATAADGIPARPTLGRQRFRAATGSTHCPASNSDGQAVSDRDRGRRVSVTVIHLLYFTGHTEHTDVNFRERNQPVARLTSPRCCTRCCLMIADPLGCLRSRSPSIPAGRPGRTDTVDCFGLRTAQSGVARKRTGRRPSTTNCCPSSAGKRTR